MTCIENIWYGGNSNFSTFCDWSQRGYCSRVSVVSLAGHPLLHTCCEGSQGKGVTALDAKGAGMLKRFLLGKDLLAWLTLWD